MSEQRFLTGSREQAFLLPPDMREWLPADHLVWVVCEAVNRLDFSAFEREYREDGQGRPAYDPRLMATLLLYAYAVGERSSRAIERRCREDVGFRVAACGLQPDHVTIARFRRRHGEALVGLFSGVLALCAEAGLVRVGVVAIDGTGIRADANKDRFCDDDALSEEARRLLAEAESEDAREDALAAEEQAALRGLLPAGFASEQERRVRLDEAAQQLGGEPQPAEDPPAVERAKSQTAKARGRALASARRGRRNRTDPDSRVLRTRAGFIQGYNAQVAVCESHVILACAVSQDNGDNRLLQPMVRRTEETLQAAGATEAPRLYLADGGYWSGAGVEELEAEGRRLLVRPNGRPRTRGRPASGPVAKMERRLARAPNKRRYRRRQALVEPVIAQLKHLRRLERLLLRGLGGAEVEWTLACAAHSLTRLARVQAAA
ncbi:MAG: transposase [Candidatus Limnocylindria bacterium]